MAKKIGVVLSGCGVFDGSEIHEAVLTLLAIDRAGAEAVCCAPNVEQAHVINHVTGEVTKNEVRNVLTDDWMSVLRTCVALVMGLWCRMTSVPRSGSVMVPIPIGTLPPPHTPISEVEVV